MRDYDVRSALKSDLTLEHLHEADDTLMVEEVGLCNEVRVDVAVVNGVLSGYEIKSARDRLTRLPAQVATYSRVLDQAVLVVAENHLQAARRELKPWWGIRVARMVNGATVLEEARCPKLNPRIDKSALVQLLWKQEAVEILATRGLDRGLRSKPRDAAWHRLTESLTLEDLRAEVRRTLKARRGWRVDPERARCDATSQSEGTLSRFLARRIR